jgi:hypothetical protein
LVLPHTRILLHQIGSSSVSEIEEISQSEERVTETLRLNRAVLETIAKRLRAKICRLRRCAPRRNEMTILLLFVATALLLVAVCLFLMCKSHVHVLATVPVTVGLPRKAPDISFQLRDYVLYPLRRSKGTRRAEVVGFKTKRRRNFLPLVTLHNGVGRLSRPASELKLISRSSDAEVLAL